MIAAVSSWDGSRTRSTSSIGWPRERPRAVEEDRRRCQRHAVEPAGAEDAQPDNAARDVDDGGHHERQHADRQRGAASGRAAAPRVDGADDEHHEGRAQPRPDDHAVRLVHRDRARVEQGERGGRHRGAGQDEERPQPAEPDRVGRRGHCSPERRRQALRAVAHERQRHEEDPERDHADDDAARDRDPAPARFGDRPRHAPTAGSDPGERRRIEVAPDRDLLEVVEIGPCRVVRLRKWARHRPRGVVACDPRRGSGRHER